MRGATSTMGWAFFVAIFACNACKADVGDDVMRLLLTNADVVILGEIESVGNGLVREANSHVVWACKIRVHTVIKGQATTTTPIRVSIDISTDNPLTPKDGDKRVFFLKEVGYVAKPDYISSDIRFSVQPASMALVLKQLARELPVNAANR